MKSNILVLGDHIQDVYLQGSVDRINQEAPCPLFDTDDQFIVIPGGAGNVAENLKALGNLVYAPYEASIPTKIRFMVGDTMIFRADFHDSCQPLDKDMSVDNFDTVVIVDYGKGSVTRDLIQSVQTQRGCKPLYVTTKRDPLDFLYQEANQPQAIMFCNVYEYAKYVTEYEQFELVIRTCGEYGLELVRYGKPFHSEPAYATKVVSVCGAGDSLMAGFIHEHLINGNPIKAAKQGSQCAAIAVGKPYTSVVYENELTGAA